MVSAATASIAASGPATEEGATASRSGGFPSKKLKKKKVTVPAPKLDEARYVASVGMACKDWMVT